MHLVSSLARDKKQAKSLLSMQSSHAERPRSNAFEALHMQIHAKSEQTKKKQFHLKQSIKESFASNLINVYTCFQLQKQTIQW